jgi:transcription elongation factor GreA-like protein
MALKIIISNADDAAEFFNLICNTYDVVDRRLNYLLLQREQLIQEQLERREYRINRENWVAEVEKELGINSESK